LLLLACMVTYVPACASGPDVVSTEARSIGGSSTTPTSESTPPTDESVPSTEPTLPVDTLPTGETTTSVSSVGDTGDGIGDTLFPSLGNPGIDVEHYSLTLRYDPARVEIAAVDHLEMAMTEDRETFTLDSAGPIVSAVSVDGVPADFTAESPELHITPATKLSRGQHVSVDVTYTLLPATVPSPAGGPVGWFSTPGGSYVLNEPEGTHTWMPCDDHPSDKATFRFELTVPTGVTAVANGALIDHTSNVSSDTWIWEEDRPMATYLIQLLTGDYELVDGVGPNGLPLLSAVLHSDRETMQPFLDVIDDQIDFFDDFFGPYPLDRYGIAITDSFPGLAMETMERPMFSRADFSAGRLDSGQQLFLSHELTHQWFGDAVSPARWNDIWLNESFATYGEWMWLDHVGLTSIADSASTGLNSHEPGSTANPSAEDMFQVNSYDGGAAILHALRKTIGDDLFFTLLRTWVADNSGQSRTTEDFVALANKVAGRDLTEFFATWLYADTLPAEYPG
jgi:aminopeptidase N